MQARIYIAVPVRDRKKVCALCLPTMRDTKASMDFLVLYNDGSTEFDNGFLWQFGDQIRSSEHVGIQEQRRQHLRHFWEQRHAYTHLYFSDSDMIMDLGWRQQALGLQADHNGALVGLYNTVAHTRMVGNIVRDEPEENFICQKFAPGCSYLLTHEHVGRIMPVIDTLNHFDWMIPSLLGHHCIISRTSYCDHIGLGGERHPAGAGPDEGDRCSNPTPYLVEKRREIMALLST